MQISHYHMPLAPLVTMGLGVLFLILGLLMLSHAAAAITSIISMLGILLIGVGIVLWGGLTK